MTDDDIIGITGVLCSGCNGGYEHVALISYEYSAHCAKDSCFQISTQRCLGLQRVLEAFVLASSRRYNTAGFKADIAAET